MSMETGDAGAGVDGAQGSDAPPPDAGSDACRAFMGPGASTPVHEAGSLGAADVEAPSTCNTVDAPFGMETAGPDTVVRVDGLVAGTSYAVRLVASADLSFYVVTGCTAPTGPTSDQCLLFEDATTTGAEAGEFVASGPTAYVVVDSFGSALPPDPTFTLDVHVASCTSNAQCGGATPICDGGACVECATSFDCHDSSRPVCGPTGTCGMGDSACTSDDGGEPDDDGPAGARVLVPFSNGSTTESGQICSSPSSEADYYAFDVASLGDTWDLGLSWTGGRDLDLALYDATGAPLGLSFWEQPEHVRLTYLPAGRYYLRVTESSSSPDPSPVAYSVTAQRTAGAPCTTAADCAATFRNQLFRGACDAGACVSIGGNGAVDEGGACDHGSDCASGLSCPSFFFVANADTRDVCAPSCSTDADCAELGANYVCTTYLQDNFCVQKCTNDLQCPTAVDDPPVSGPWFRLSCDMASGRCVP